MRTIGIVLTALLLSGTSGVAMGQGQSQDQKKAPTREFEIRNDRAYLGGQPIRLWGARSGNALYSWNVTERHVNCLDTMVAHGINTIGCNHRLGQFIRWRRYLFFNILGFRRYKTWLQRGSPNAVSSRYVDGSRKPRIGEEPESCSPPALPPSSLISLPLPN
jgi:hypothetical protein